MCHGSRIDPGVALAGLILMLGACESSPTSPTDSVETLLVTTRTSGVSLDADGYMVRLEGRDWRPIEISGTSSAAVGAVGDVVVGLTGLADNCAVRGSNPRTVTVARGSVPSVDFHVECGSVPRDLAFATDRDGDWEIYAVGSDGSYAVRLTNYRKSDRRPEGSPDGETIAFIHEGWVSLMGADGSGMHLLNAGGAKIWWSDIAWSPDGTRLAVHDAGWEGWDWCPADDLWILSADGSRAGIRVPGALEAAWSPDGTKLAFSHAPEPCSAAHIRMVDADGTNPVDLTGTRGAESGPAWSPDGTRIAFTRRQEGNEDLYVMGSDGTDLVRVTTNPERDYDPIWSRDGESIVFTSERDGNAEIYIVAATGSDPVNLTRHPADDRSPTWLVPAPSAAAQILRRSPGRP